MRRVLALVPLLFVACAGSEERALDDVPASAAALTPETFCDAYAQKLCRVREACSCTALAECVAEHALSCAERIVSPQVMGAIERGAIGFDADAAGALFAKLTDAESSCGAPLEALEWTQGDLLDFGGVLRGKLEAGAACELPFFGLGPNECAEGICTGEAGVFACVAVANVGEACGLNTDRGEVRCLDADAAVARTHLSFDRMFGPCVAGVCEARRSVDSACEGDGWCDSGRCERLTRPTTEVELHLDLDRNARPTNGAFAPNDARTFQYRVTIPIVDEAGDDRDAQLYLFRSDTTEWGYSAMVDGEVIAVGALIFDDEGALEIDYAVTGATFESVTPIAFDFGDSLAEGGTGLEGTRLVDDGFAVRHRRGDEIVSTPYCAPLLLDGSACDADVVCASGACEVFEGQRICRPASAPMGAACAADGDCSSRACVEGFCGAAWCG